MEEQVKLVPINGVWSCVPFCLGSNAWKDVQFTLFWKISLKERNTLSEYLTRSYSPRWQRRSYEYEGGGGGGGAGDFRHRMASSTNMTDHATLSAAAAGRSRWVKECLFRSLMACSSARTKMNTKMLESRLETLQWGRNIVLIWGITKPFQKMKFLALYSKCMEL